MQHNDPGKSTVRIPPGFTLSPDVDVTSIALQPAPKCDSCVRASLQLSGPVGYDGGVLGRGEVQVAAQAVAVVKIGVRARKREVDLVAEVDAVRKVQVDVEGLPRRLASTADEQLRAWTEDTLKSQGPTVLLTLDRNEYRLRAVQPRTDGIALRLELLTQAYAPGPLPRIPDVPEDGWELHVSHASAVALAATEGFAAGPQTAAEVVAVPSSLAFERGTFAVGLRVWRLTPPGWWRDLRIDAALQRKGEDWWIQPADAVVLDTSEGAGWADPLSWLAQGFLRDAVLEYGVQSFPVHHRFDADGSKVDLELGEIMSRNDTLVVRGGLTIVQRGQRQGAAEGG